MLAQYVGTRAVNQPYLTQVNGYQTVCQGCFAPFPYAQPTDPRFGAVTQFSTGANSHYHGLQLTGAKRLGHGLQGQVNYTWSRCMDTVSNGGFLQFSAGAVLSPLPGKLARDYGPCDYDIRHNLNAQYVYELPIKVRSHTARYALNGWQVSGTVFWHSGIPFPVLSTPYSACRQRDEWHCAGQWTAIRQPRSRRHRCMNTTQSRASRNRARSSGSIRMPLCPPLTPVPGLAYVATARQNCQFGNLGRNALRGPDFTWSDFYITKLFPLTEHAKLRLEAQFFNLFNHPNFALPSMVSGGHSEESLPPQTGFGALTYPTSPPTGLLGVGLGGDSSPRMIAFQARIEF